MSETIDTRFVAADYSCDDRIVWTRLMQAYEEHVAVHACAEIRQGIDLIGLSSEIPAYHRIRCRILDLTGWTIVPVAGLVSQLDFADLLSQKKYPFSVIMRSPPEASFTIHPDIFHDWLGHMPMLTVPSYRQYLSAYAEAVQRYSDNARVLKALSRTFWFTAETGLVLEDGNVKVFGAAILTSVKELNHALASGTKRYPFDLKDIVRRRYSYRQLQRQYYVMNSLDEFSVLSACLGDVAAAVHR
ncbi:MAG: hypothetical protein AAF613_09830 [Pseudomonadota bacterium]